MLRPLSTSSILLFTRLRSHIPHRGVIASTSLRYCLVDGRRIAVNNAELPALATAPGLTHTPTHPYSSITTTTEAEVSNVSVNLRASLLPPLASPKLQNDISATAYTDRSAGRAQSKKVQQHLSRFFGFRRGKEWQAALVELRAMDYMVSIDGEVGQNLGDGDKSFAGRNGDDTTIQDTVHNLVLDTLARCGRYEQHMAEPA